MDTKRLAELLREAFHPIFGAEEIDVLPSDAGDELDIVDGAWTVHVEGWPDQPVATVAIDRELDPPYTLHDSREEVMAYEIDEAFAYVDEQVSGALTTALKASGDPLSLDLLESMAAHRQRFLDSGLEIPRVA